jgi:hypothetical protein
LIADPAFKLFSPIHEAFGQQMLAPRHEGGTPGQGKEFGLV